MKNTATTLTVAGLNVIRMQSLKYSDAFHIKTNDLFTLMTTLKTLDLGDSVLEPTASEKYFVLSVYK